MKKLSLLTTASSLIATLALVPAIASAQPAPGFPERPLPIQNSNNVVVEVEQDGPDSTRTITTIQKPPTETVIVNKTTIYGQQLAHLLKDKPQAKRFYNLLVTSGLGKPLDKGFTAFVPVDEAFAGSTVGTAYSAGVVDPAARKLLEDHIVEGKYATALLDGRKFPVHTLSGNTLVLSQGNFNTFYVNGVRIRDTLRTPQGIIYFVDQHLSK